MAALAQTSSPTPSLHTSKTNHNSSASPTMADPTTNILLTSFAGLGLPRTRAWAVKSSTPISKVVSDVFDLLPPALDDRLILTTTSNKQLRSSDTTPISALIPDAGANFLPLRLSARLCGGKGGFGSQLRAAGGRMSSRKNRNQNQNPNGSNRNLDGRRLRVIDSAKDLARYLATKPEMEAKEREEKRKRWEDVVEAAERREADIRSGKAGKERGRLDADFVESKDAAEEKTREAVLKAMREEVGSGMERTGSESSAEAGAEASDDEDVEEGSSGSSDDVKDVKMAESSRTFFGWDEEDDDSDDDSIDEVPAKEVQYKGKGKGKATS